MMPGQAFDHRRVINASVTTGNNVGLKQLSDGSFLYLKPEWGYHY